MIKVLRNFLTFLLLFLTSFLFAFQNTSVEFDSTIIEVNGITIFQTTLNVLDGFPRTKRENFVEEVWTFDENIEEVEWVLDKGLRYSFIPDQYASQLYELLYEEVIEAGSFLFLTNTNYDDEFNSYVDIAVLPCTDPYKHVKDMGVMAVNYDLFTHDIVAKLKEWDQEMGLRIETIQGDLVAFYMTKPPEDLNKFAADVYEFCPDVIDQGFGSMKALKKSIKNYQYLYLWWD